MQKAVYVAALAAGLAVLAGCDLEDLAGSERFSQDFHYSYPLKPGGTLTVENFNGSVEIAGWNDNSVEINGAKYARSAELRDAIRIDVEAGGDSVRIRTVRPSDRRGNMGARYVIKVPHRIRLDRIVSSNGSIRVDGIEGDAKLRTSNATVRTTNLLGDLDAETSNASINVLKLDGSAVLRTSNGSVHADETRGGVEASTSNAGITVRLAASQATRPIKLETSNGGVELAINGDPKGNVRIRTSNGGITLRLPETANAEIEASTSNASINCEFSLKTSGEAGKHHLQGTLGSGGPRLELSTSNGGIRLLRL